MVLQCKFHLQKKLFSGDENGKREEDLEEEIKDVKERFRDAEVKAEMAERTVQKLQTEIDRMEVVFSFFFFFFFLFLLERIDRIEALY